MYCTKIVHPIYRTLKSVNKSVFYHSKTFNHNFLIYTLKGVGSIAVISQGLNHFNLSIHFILPQKLSPVSHSTDYCLTVLNVLNSVIDVNHSRPEPLFRPGEQIYSRFTAAPSLARACGGVHPVDYLFS